MKRVWLSWVLLAPLFSIAQSDSAWLMARSITPESLKSSLSVIASPVMEGRETGTRGQRRAAAYIEKEFKKIGLQSPGSLINYQQDFPYQSDTLVPRNLRIGKTRYAWGVDYLVAASPGPGKALNGVHLIFAGYGIADKNYDDYAGKDVKGRVVLIVAGEPKSGTIFLTTGTTRPSLWDIHKKLMAAASRGAAGVLIADPSADHFSIAAARSGAQELPDFSGREGAALEKTPLVLISRRVMETLTGKGLADSILGAARAQNPLTNYTFKRAIRIKLNYERRKNSTTTSNIIGYIEGTDRKADYVLVTAHYDHLGTRDGNIYYGADDDGSGVASLLSIARGFENARMAGFGPRRTVVFMTVSGEEEGLLGSAYYTDHPVFPLDSTTADLNTDMIGRIDPARKYGDSLNYVYVIGDDKLSTDLHPLVTGINKKYTHLELDPKFNSERDPLRIFYRSDHYNFARRGVPILFFFDGINKDYHQPTDTVDKINFELMNSRVRLIFLTAWKIANRDRMLKRDLALPAGGE